jgi:ATP-dependent RNA helicase DDX20
LSEGILSADTVRLVVLDEADKLLESSFLEDTTAILQMLPTNKQVVALSATYPDELARLAEKLMRAPAHIRPGQESQVLHGVHQFVLPVESSPVRAKQNQEGVLFVTTPTAVFLLRIRKG